MSFKKSVSITNENFEKELLKNYEKDGLAIITDVFTQKECGVFVDGIVDGICNLGTGIDKNNITESWKDYNLPPQTRPGLFQTSLSNLKEVWDIRSHPNVRKIFEIVYSHFRKTEIRDFIVSGDGINIKPGNVGPYANSRDWAHLDQTFGDVYKCVQGQAVLTNTTASFRATPGSHRLFPNILSKYNIQSKKNWFKFENVDEIKSFIEEKGCDWQIPIVAPKGSFIIWSSSTIHSAKVQDSPEFPTESDPYNGWRCVVYVCYRPKSEFTKAQLKKRKKVFDENRLTNHWGDTMFGKKPGSQYNYTTPRHPIIETIIKNPVKVYEMIGKPDLTIEQKRLLGED